MTFEYMLQVYRSILRPTTQRRLRLGQQYSKTRGTKLCWVGTVSSFFARTPGVPLRAPMSELRALFEK